ncbi:MAG: hypothetical protein ABI627_25780, partial [Polyangiaceae bacterium]
MTQRSVGFFGGSLALIGALAANPAHADAPAPPVPHAETPEALRYQAPEACPNRAQFIAAVAGRGASFVGKGTSPATAFQVDIEQRTGGFHASLAVQNGALTSNAREVSGPSCVEVVDALAVVTAIALNPSLGAPAPPPAVAVPEPVPVVTRAAPEPPRAPLSGRNFGWKETLEVPAGKLHLDSAIAINAFVGGTLGIAPGRVLPRLDITVSRANFVTAPDGQSFVTGTVARLRASLLLDTTWRFGDVRTQVGGEEVGVGLCYTPHYDTAGWVLLGCGEVSVGVIGITERAPAFAASADGSGFATTIEQKSTQGFGAVGLNLEASYNLASHFQIGARIGAQAFTSDITA